MTLYNTTVCKGCTDLWVTISFKIMLWRFNAVEFVINLSLGYLPFFVFHCVVSIVHVIQHQNILTYAYFELEQTFLFTVFGSIQERYLIDNFSLNFTWDSCQRASGNIKIWKTEQRQLFVSFNFLNFLIFDFDSQHWWYRRHSTRHNRKCKTNWDFHSDRKKKWL